MQRIDALELAFCLRVSRAMARAYPARRFFSLISRLGDGCFWYVYLALLPVLFGRDGTMAALHMSLVALLGIVVYKALKVRLVRDRPYFVHADIDCSAMPLDRYSFPSGHTLHAMSFTVLTLHYFPQLAWAIVPFAVLVALSRVITGLHYPSDVLAGGLIGYALAEGSLYLYPLAI